MVRTLIMATELEILKKLTEALACDNCLADQTVAWEYAFNSVTDLVCITNTSYKIKFLNTKFLEKLPATIEFYINKTINELFETYEEDLGLCHLPDVDDGGVNYGEIFLPEFGGWYIKNRYTIRNDSDDIIGYTFMFSDVTARRQKIEARLELKRNEELLEGVFNVIPDIIGIQDVNNNAIRYNKAGREFFNVTTEELRTKKCYELVGRHTFCPDCQTQRCKETKQPEKQLKYITELDGWYDCRSYPILDDNGNVVQVVEHLRDVTELKANQEHREAIYAKMCCAFQRLHFIIAAVNGYIWEKEVVKQGEELVYSYIDPTLCRDFYKLDAAETDDYDFTCFGAIGATSTELINKYCRDNRVHSFIDICTIADAHCIEQKEPCDYFEMGYIEGASGELEWLILRVRKEPVFNDDGEVTGLLGFADNCSTDMHSIRQLIWQGLEEGSIKKLADTGKAKVYWVVKKKKEAADLSYLDFP